MRNYIKPFVCRNKPYVCLEHTYVSPFICNTIPLVCFKKNKRGFTLIELLITLVIVGILAAYAVPAMQTFIRNQRMSTLANDFLADFNYARSEAARRGGVSVGLCSGTGVACSSTPSFSAGWLIFLDSNASNGFDAGEEIIRRREDPSGGNIVMTATTAGHTVLFNARGFASGGTGNFVLCDDRGPTQGREISTSVSGQILVLKSRPAACP